MPHIGVKCYNGRTDEQKLAVARKIAASAAEAFGLDVSQVSVSVEDVEKSGWKRVYDEEIIGKPETLFVEPGYEL